MATRNVALPGLERLQWRVEEVEEMGAELWARWIEWWCCSGGVLGWQSWAAAWCSAAMASARK